MEQQVRLVSAKLAKIILYLLLHNSVTYDDFYMRYRLCVLVCARLLGGCALRNVSRSLVIIQTMV